MNKNKTIVSGVVFDPTTLQTADKIVKNHMIAGVTSRSGLIAYALNELFKTLPESQKIMLQEV